MQLIRVASLLQPADCEYATLLELGHHPTAGVCHLVYHKTLCITLRQDVCRIFVL